MKTNRPRHASQTGGILPIVMVVLIAFSLMVVALLQLGQNGAQETAYQLRRAQAFWLAEAGRQRCIADLYSGGTGVLSVDATLGTGTFDVRIDPANPNRRISRGIVTAGNLIVTNQIRIDLAYLARPFEHAIYAGNYVNQLWSFQLRGTGAAMPPGSGSGGVDSIYGDVYIRGNAFMADSSAIYPPNPNRYSLHGDLNTTGTSTLDPGASVAGSRNQNVPYNQPPDLPAMDYANNNNYDIAKIFNDANILSGRLPPSHPLYSVLYNVVVKNPSDRAAENNSTPGMDDFYFEPASIGSAGTQTTGVTPLNLGTNKVYYVDGHVWFDSHSTYGFKVDGTATIVSTRDIHVSDNLAYNNKGLTAVGGNPPDLLALVALGKYDAGGVLISGSGGNIYFGDPEFGTLYTVDAFMFAGNNFYYNTSANSGGQKEPTSGFKVFGNYMAVNQVVVLRDWYTGADGLPHAASYDQTTSQWKDAANPSHILTSTELASRRHYAMRVEYDDRIRDSATQMPGLPRGNGTIFAGAKGWEEI
ncbi:MAG: hypothetical protein WCH86_02420 [Kiritimatiellales bacterium]